jgi:DNA-binding beta-propeller fold protein YncE
MNRREFLSAAAALPVALRASPDAFARRLGGTPLALVTADTEEHVAAVLAGSARILRRIPTLPGPRSIENGGATTAVVAHTAHGAVSLVDGLSLRVTRVLRGFEEPRYTAMDSGGQLAYVTDSRAGEVVVVDMRRGRVVHRTELGGPARHVSIDPFHQSLWVALGSKARDVAVLDLTDDARPRLARIVRPPFLAHDVGFTPAGDRVWVTSGDRGTIGVYDSRSLRRLFSITADAPPQHVTFVGGRAYVTSGDDARLRVHRVADGLLLRTTPVPVGSYNVQQGGGFVLTPSLERGTLCTLDRRGVLLERVQVARSSHDACFVLSN